MKRSLSRPSLLWTLPAIIGISVLWLWIRLVLFADILLPLTYVLPLLICIWTRRYWQLLAMSIVFLAAVAVELWMVLPQGAVPSAHRLAVFLATTSNILIGSLVIGAIMAMRDRLERQRNQLADQNDEIRQQAEELAQQTEELQTQQEELAQQHEELENQSEELAQQNEELHAANSELSHREGMLEALLQVTGPARGDLGTMCKSMLAAIGRPCVGLFVLRRAGSDVQVLCSASTLASASAQNAMPYENSIVEVMAQERRTAYIEDIRTQPDLIAPGYIDLPTRSILATPLQLHQGVIGALVAVSDQPGHWSTEQFRLIEWIAGHTSLVLEMMQQQNDLEEVAKVPEQNPDAVLRITRGGQLLYANPAGRSLLQRCGGTDSIATAFLEGVDAALNHGVLQDREIVLSDEIYSVRFAPQVAMGYANVYAHDITRRVQAETLARASDAKLHAMAASGIVGLLYGDIEGRIYDCNDELARIIGYSREDVLAGKVRWDAITPAEDLPLDAAKVEEARRNGSCKPYEKRYRRPDGSIIWVFVGYTLLEPDRKLSVAFVLDITARKAAEQAAAEGATRLRIALDSAGLGTWTYWMNDDRWEVDRRAQELYMLDRSVLFHDEQTVRGLLHPDDLQPMWDRVQAAIAPGSTGQYRARYRVPDGSGDYRWLEAWGRVEFQGEGKTRVPVRMIGVSRDITDDYRAQEAIRLAKAEAEEASNAKDHFLAVLSHELRTPLTPVVMSVAEMLNHPELPDEIRDDLTMIQRNVDLETRLIDDLLDVTRIARGKLEMQMHPAELCRIVRHAAETCLADARNRGLQLDLDFGAEELQVDADPARLQQVFWNLIKNAVKFTAAHGRIRVTCNRDGAHAIVRVMDTGIGMDPETCTRVFNAFEQGGRGVTRKFGGLGLGLAITKAIVEMHGGTVVATSDGPGCGSTFTVRLPLIHHAAPVDTGSGPETPSITGAGRVLLVEDHPDSARLLKRLLSRTGWHVRTAGDVASALRCARAESFDVIVSDIGLPDGTGLDLMRQLRLEQPRLRGIALSGHGMETDVQLSRAAGFSLHLVKPVNPIELQQAITTVLDSETETLNS